MVIEYANFLAELGHKVTIYVAINDTLFELHPDVKLVNLPCKSKLAFLLFSLTHNSHHEVVIVDIIHLAVLVNARNSVIYFAQANDIEYYRSFLARKFIDLFYRVFLNKKAMVISVDASLSKIFADRYGFNESHTVTNGIDLTKFFPEPDPGLIAAKGARIAVVFMARGDHYRKGFDYTLELLDRFRHSQEYPVEFWICGEKLVSSDYPFPVREFGTLSDGRLRQILSSADVFLYPSRHEGFGLFPLEAMACGCVAMTSDAVPYARQIPSIMVSAVGDIQEMFEQVRLLSTDADLCATLKSQALLAAKKFDLLNSKRKFAHTLSGLLAGVDYAHWD